MPAEPFCVLVNGLPAAGKTTIGRAVSTALQVPLLSKDAVKDFVASTWSVEPSPARLSELGHRALWLSWKRTRPVQVVETWFGPTGCDRVAHELRGAGIPQERVVEVWCDCPKGTAFERFCRRHEEQDRGRRHDHAALDWAWWDGQDAQPLGLGHQVGVDTTILTSVSTDEVVEKVRAFLS